MALEHSADVLMNLLLGELPHRINPESTGDALYTFGWEKDIVVVAAFTVLMLVARELVSELVLKPVARSFGVLKNSKLIKFCEAGWFFVFYVPMCFWGFAITFRHQMSFPLRRIYADMPQETCGLDVKLYMMLSEAWYFHALVVVTVLQSKRKDFWESLIHHVTTILLIFIGRGFGLLHIAVTLLILHCPADILLYLAKLFNYINYRKTCDMVFASFALSFFVTRIVWYPAVVWSFYTMALDSNPDWPFYLYHSAVTLMTTLQCLHILWFRMVMKMVFEAVSKGTVEKDSRSDDD